MMRPKTVKNAQEALSDEDLKLQKKVSEALYSYSKDELSFDSTFEIVKNWNLKHPGLTKIHPEDYKNKTSKYLNKEWWKD